MKTARHGIFALGELQKNYGKVLKYNKNKCCATSAKIEGKKEKGKDPSHWPDLNQ